MNTYKINSSSWHYRFLHAWHGRGINNVTTSFCAYWSSLVWALLITTVAAVACVAFAAVMIVGTVGLTVELWRAVTSGVWGFAATYTVVMLSLLVVAVAFKWLSDAYDDYRARRDLLALPKQPGLIAQAYRSWKHKYCLPVEIINDSK